MYYKHYIYPYLGFPIEKFPLNFLKRGFSVSIIYFDLISAEVSLVVILLFFKIFNLIREIL